MAEDLDQAQLDLFNDLRENHNETGSFHENNAVTALTVVTSQANQPVDTRVFLVAGLLYGNDLTDRAMCTGWRVSSVQLYNSELRAMVLDKWQKSRHAKSHILPHTVFVGRKLNRISPGDIQVPQEQDTIVISGTEKQVTRRSLELSCPAVSKRHCSFYEALISEVWFYSSSLSFLAF